MEITEAVRQDAPLPAPANGAEPKDIPSERIKLFLAARPLSPPKTHHSRTVTIVGPHDASLCVSGPSYELQKAYRCASPLHHAVHSRGTWENACDRASGFWESQGAIHLGAHTSQEVWLDDLRNWVELLNKIGGQPAAAIALGRLAREHRRDASCGRWLVPDKRDRYEDTPSRWFVVDLDHLPGEPDDVDGILPDFVEETIPELQGCAFVAAFTGSAGIKGNRARLIFELEEPRTLAAMRSFALGVNGRAGSDVIDASLYTPGHLVLTAAPLLYADVAHGQKVTRQNLPRPVRSTAWFVDGDLAAIPDVSVTNVTGVGYVPREQRGESLSKAAAAELLQSVGPGKYSVPLHRWLCHIAWNSPEHRQDSDFAAAVSAIQDRIRETSDAQSLAKRLREHGNVRALRRAWDAARERRESQSKATVGTPLIGTFAESATVLPSLSGIAISTVGAAEYTGQPYPVSTTAVVPQTIDDVRKSLQTDVANEAAAIIGGNHRHVLFLHPAGTGKTTGFLSAVTAGRLSSDRIRYRIPTHKLGEELVGKLKPYAFGLAPHGQYHGVNLPAAIRHHKGRAQPGMCPDPVSKPLADRAESLGVSVKKHVCANCATGKAGSCPWLAQDDDTDAGVIVEAHQAALSPSKAPADLVVFDEGILAAVVQSDDTPPAIGDLAKTGTIFAVRPGNVLGSPLQANTLALNNYRDDLVRALRASVPTGIDGHGRLEISAIPALVADVTYEARVGMRRETRIGPGVAHAIELEKQLQTTLYARIANPKTALDKQAEAVALLRSSQSATRLYEAIAPSASRTYVFGVATYVECRGKIRIPRVKCCTRSAEPPSEASISFDGTADVGVWRALMSPNGASFDERIYDARPEIAPGSLTVYQYRDRAGALSSLVSDDTPGAAEIAATERRDWLRVALPWVRAAYDDPGAPLAAAEIEVAGHATKRRTRKVRADSHLEMLWRFVLFEAARHAPQAVPVGNQQVSLLLIAQKAVVDRLAGFRLPPTVAVAHFGALRGLDAFRDVPCCVVVGRPRPADIDLELQAEALHMHNQAVGEIGRRPPGQWSEGHPDARVAAVQWVTTAAEIKQSVARIRPYDRTPAKPCALHVFGIYDTGLPAELVQTCLWSDADRSPAEVALAYGAVFSDNRLNQRAYPGLFPKGNAAGDGQADREIRARFTELVSNLGRQFESRPYPYKEIGEMNSTVSVRTGFADALAYPGIEPEPTRQHRLVRLRTPASRKASFALIDSRWDQAAVERRLGCVLTYWHELDTREVLTTRWGALPTAAP